MGTLSYFLGTQTSFTNIIIHLSKQKYIDLIKCTWMTQCKPFASTVCYGQQLSRYPSTPLDDEFLIKEPLKLFNTWLLLDIDKHVLWPKSHNFFTFNENIGSRSKWILRYLQVNGSHGLVIHKFSSTSLHAYSDVDCVGLLMIVDLQVVIVFSCSK